MDIERHTSQLIQSLIEADRRHKWKHAFRASSMPFCQLQKIWFEMDKALGDLPGRKQSFMGDFFMNSGTAVHTATQRWLGRLGILFGNWACANPWCTDEKANAFDQDREPIPMVTNRFGPQRCLTCKKELIYCEYYFDDPPTGHCDGLIKFGELTPEDNDFVLLEVKTADVKKIHEEFYKIGPPMSYKLQATVYTHKLNSRGFNIKGVLFLFIPRGDPRSMAPYWYRVGPKKAARIHDSILVDSKRANEALETGTFDGIGGSCLGFEDAYSCPYRVNCFSPIAKKLFREKYDQFYKKEEGRPPHINPVLPVFPG